MENNKECGNSFSKAQIEALSLEIQPHFLYNALNAIQYYCEVEPEKAGRLIRCFARMLRGNMHAVGQETPVPFAREKEHLECYLELEKLRFPEMQIVYDVPQEDFTLPALTLQPLVKLVAEAQPEEEKRVKVAARCQGKSTVLSICGECSVLERQPATEEQEKEFQNVRARVMSVCNGVVEKREKEGRISFLVRLPEREKKADGCSCGR